MKKIAIIPAFNENSHLRNVVERSSNYVDQVIVVDDGSRPPLIDHWENQPQVSLIRHSINLGKGSAMKTGVAQAKLFNADIIVFLDADGQHKPEEIPNMILPISNDSIELTLGVRHFHSSMPLMAKMGNIFLSKALKVLFGLSTSDSQSGFRALRSDLYEKIKWESPRYAVETEMLVNAAKKKIKVKEVPIQTIYHDKFKGTTVLDGIRIFVNMISWRVL